MRKVLEASDDGVPVKVALCADQQVRFLSLDIFYGMKADGGDRKRAKGEHVDLG